MARRHQTNHDRNSIITALLYTRVSSDEQAKEGLSLAAQLQSCRRYCAERGWLISSEHQDVLSGSRDDRPAYRALLAEARRLSSDGRHVAVVVMRLDRFGRRLPERIRSREELKQLGVMTHSVREGECSDLMANMLAVLAQEEVERLGDRVRDVREHNQQNGWHLPGRAPWGYRWRAATAAERMTGAPRSVLEVDEVTASYVCQTFLKAAAGESLRSLTRWLEKLPPEARGFVSVGRPRILRVTAIRLVLQGRVYIGQFPDHTQGRWTPLVQPSVFNAVQDLIAKHPSRSPQASDYLLTGFLNCSLCGSRMGGWTKEGRARYRCSRAAVGGIRECPATATAMPVDGDVLVQVTELLTRMANTDANVRAALTRAWETLRKPDDADSREQRRQRVRAERDAADARRRLTDAARLLVDGTLDRAGYLLLADDEQRRLKAADDVLSAPATRSSLAELPPLPDVLSAIRGWDAVIGDAPTSAQRQMLATLIESVTPIRLSHGKYATKIVWTPLGNGLQTAASHAAA